MALLDTSGRLAAKYTYDPFGNTLARTGALADLNPYRFSTKEYSTVSGLYSYGFRFYDPNLQRWLTRDPLGEPGFEVSRRTSAAITASGLNLYSFLGNDPVNALDTWGNTWYKPWTWEWPEAVWVAIETAFDDVPAAGEGALKCGPGMYNTFTNQPPKLRFDPFDPNSKVPPTPG